MKKTPKVKKKKVEQQKLASEKKFPQYRTTPTSTLIPNYIGKTWHNTVSSH